MRRTRPHPRRRGTILLPALLFSVVLAGAAVAYSTMVGAAVDHRGHSLRAAQTELAAEAALAAAVVELRAGRSATLGSEAEPVTFGGYTYYTEVRQLGVDRVSVLAVGSNGREEQALEALLEVSSMSTSSQAVFALDNLRIASNVAIDSYDPTLGDYASQAVRVGNVTVANRNGHIATNGSLEIGSNSDVFGDARWGPEASDTYTSSGSVDGTAAPLTSNLEFEPPTPPAGPSSGPLTVDPRTAVSIGPGLVVLDDVLVDRRGALTIVGPAQVVVESFELAGLGTLTVDAAAGEIEIFCAGEFRLQSNSRVLVDASDATEVTLVLLAEQASESDRNPPLQFDSNGSWIGTIVAPSALVSISSNFEIFGAIIARWVSLSSNTRLHYDERLAEGGAGAVAPEWSILGTRKLSSSQVAAIRGGVAP